MYYDSFHANCYRSIVTRVVNSTDRNGSMIFLISNKLYIPLRDICNKIANYIEIFRIPNVPVSSYISNPRAEPTDGNLENEGI